MSDISRSGRYLPVDLSPPIVSPADGLHMPATAVPVHHALRVLRARPAPGFRPFDVDAIRADFPILSESVHGRPLVWLDNAATTQKPRAVIDRLVRFYETENSNVHRGAHTLAAKATEAYEGARETVRRFLNAQLTSEIVFTRGATEGINLVAASWGRRHLNAGDEIVIGGLEHHSNIVPWQVVAAQRGARIRVIPVDERGDLRLDVLEELLGPRTRLVAVAQVSNAIGTVTPIAGIVKAAHRVGARVLVDGAQAVSHMRVDVRALGADFYVLSGHKVYGPTGIGVLYGTADAFADMPLWQSGGNTISEVTFERTLYQPPPARFEAGTGSIADAVALGAALEYLEDIGPDSVGAHEAALMARLVDGFGSLPGVTTIGEPRQRAGAVSFLVNGHTPARVASALDLQGIAVRSGHHCAQPALRHFGTDASVRASLAMYNTQQDIDALLTAVRALVAD